MLNISLPPIPEKKKFKADGKQPYNLVSLLSPKIKYNSEMKQYEERLALLEKRWPGLKECDYNVELYSRKRFYDLRTKFEIDLMHLSGQCNKIKELQDAIDSYEIEPYPISCVFQSKETPLVSYYKELIQSYGGFGIFVDLYNKKDDVIEEVNKLNQREYSHKFGLEGKYFFVVNSIVSSDTSRVLGFDDSPDVFYAVACCPLSLSLIKAIGFPDKNKEIKALEKRLQELKINKIMADNGFDEHGRLHKQ